MEGGSSEDGGNQERLSIENVEIVDDDNETDVKKQSIEDDESIADVEVNADSRFIDFSLVTPWEHLVADIEKALKTWMNSKGMIYQNIWFRIYFSSFQMAIQSAIRKMLK